MIADKIRKYLESGEKRLNPEVLTEVEEMFGRGVKRQLMEEREDRPGHEYATLYTKPCARQSAFKYHGFGGESLSARAQINFFCGDTVEMAVWGLARLAGCKITGNNEKLWYGDESDKLTVKPDGLLDHKGELYNVEIKKMNEHVYDRVLDQGLQDTFGYLTQTMLEIEGWRHAGKDVNSTVFVMIRGLTGHVEEIVIDYEESFVQASLHRRDLTVKSTKENLPERFFETVDETVWERGKPKEGHVVTERKKTGYWRSTGRRVLPMECGYCSYKDACYDNKLELSTEKGKPKWVVDAALVNGPEEKNPF